MKNSTQLNCEMRLKSGFTLVELAIVIVVIGLLVGGVLQGQELIQQAKIRGVLAQLREYDTAIGVFKAKYNNSIPGDFDKATAFGIGDNLAEEVTGNFDPPLKDGNNDGVLNYQPNVLNGGRFGYELKNFFVMLSNAGLVKGNFSQSPPNAQIRTAYPELATGGGMIVVSSNNSLYYLLAATSSYTSFETQPAIDEGITSNGFINHILTPEEAYSIDSKLDDGKPNLGSAQTFWTYNGNNGSPNYFSQYNTGSDCATSDNDNDPNSNYVLSNNNKACMIYVKASN